MENPLTWSPVKKLIMNIMQADEIEGVDEESDLLRANKIYNSLKKIEFLNPGKASQVEMINGIYETILAWRKLLNTGEAFSGSGKTIEAFLSKKGWLKY